MDTPPSLDLAAYENIFTAFAFIMGAIVGSFLNVCIYRLPLDLSVNEPKRSFCPHCKKQIPWSQNIPLVSWLALRGKCANCGAPIAFRYFGVELLTAVLFLAAWVKCWHSGAWAQAFPLWILLGLMVVATFIDFEHFIIPNEITWGGVAAGMVCSLALPALMGVESHWMGLLWSAAAAAAGYGTLWLVVELGKKAFGKKRIELEKPEPFTWTRHGDDADLEAGGDTMKWSDLFSRPTDILLMHVEEARIGEKSYEDTTLTFYYNRLQVNSDEYELDKLDTITGVVTGLVIPREAMGFGDVKFIAAIGAFLGLRAVFFTITSGSIIGALIGLAMILIGKREWSARIPFGPYLALGAVIWIFAGPQLLDAYWNWIQPPQF
ncbi:MAG TPA: prepilin peptidase [Chthoniobacteraceae bacterium]|nr:prepilin peptidase [Chthoniobacteraceae bacterium]